MGRGRSIVFLLFIPSLIGVIALLSITYVSSGGQYIFPYSVKEYLLKAPWVIAAFIVIYVIFDLFTVFGNDLSGLNLNIKLNIYGRYGKQVEYDADGAIVAYRYFYLVPNVRGKPIPYSAGQGGVGRNPITNRFRGDYSGGWNISDRVPTKKNSSGIYAAKTKTSHILDSYRYSEDVENGTMKLARVKLSGRVIEGQYGYRAQYCEIEEFIE